MILTDEMKQAMELIETTNQPLYITGKAGTGKTTLLKHIVSNIRKRFVVTASTGIAAVNAGGITLHSLLTIPIGIIDPNAKMKMNLSRYRKELIQSIDAIIIDEISMITPDIIDYVDKKLRAYRKNDNPFGGVQIIMFGDLYQLPPVVTRNDKDVLLQFYRGAYFFYARVFKETPLKIVELTNVFRQSDERFIKILNDIRSYNVTDDDIAALSKLRDRNKSKDYNDACIHICSLKRDVQKINLEMLGEPTNTFVAETSGDFNIKYAPCDHNLQLRIGARVMVLINDQHQVYCNGSLGVVSDIQDDKVIVLLDNGCSVAFEPYEWEICDYCVKDGKVEKNVKGKCKQFPLTLAWAITIHKSQGLTFDKVAIHSKTIFAPGQMYVALSRCKTMDGIVTETFITKSHILVDKQIVAFERAYRANDFMFNRKILREMKL